jgi:putative DNA primase/helicase
MTVLSPHASEETKFNGKIGQLKASKPLIQELIPGLKRKSDKEYCGPCPHCKDGEDRFIVFTETQTYWCRQCNAKGDILSYITLTTGKSVKEQLEEAGLASHSPAKKRGSKQQFIWRKSKSGDSPAYQYFSKTRGITDLQPSPAVRWNSFKDKNGGEPINRIVLRLSKPGDTPEDPASLHYLFLDTAANPPKKTGIQTSNAEEGAMKGRAVWFYPDKDTKTVAVAEGAETTLSALSVLGLNGAAALTTSGLKGIVLPQDTKELLIFCDQDTAEKGCAGQKAALELAERFEKGGGTAWIVSPSDQCFAEKPEKLDFNDLLKQDPSGELIRARFEKKQRTDEIGWRPPKKESPENPAEQDNKKPAEVWILAEVKEILEHPELLKWMICTDQELDTIQRHEIAEEILLHNSFRPAELNAVRDMLKKQLGIAKGEQDKLLKAARKKKHNGCWFLTEEDEKGCLRLIAQNRAAEKISEMVYDKYMFASDIQHWHSFTGTHWADDSKDDNFGSHLVDVLGDGAGDVGFNAGYMAGVESIMIRSGKHKPAAENGKTRVPFQNGVLDPETGMFEQTTPDNALRWCLPYKYDPDAKCELFDWWLDFACDDETGGLQKQIMAVINVCIVERPDLQYFLHLVGEPGTGKGLFARLLQAIVGPEGFWKSDFKLLDENQFEPTNYYQKRLVQFDEVPAHVKINKFLQLTGRDRLRYEEKKKQATQHFIFTGLVLLLGNSLFSTDDQTTFAIERRRRTVRFDKEIPSEVLKEFADAGGEKLLHDEIPGIINKALRMSREEVTEIFRNPPAKVVKANQEAEETSSPVVKFVTEHVQYDPAGKVYPGVKRLYKGEGGRDEYEGQEDKLYPRYLAWCSRESRTPLAKTKALDAILRAVNRNLVPSEGRKVEMGGHDKKGTPIIRISMVPWKETEFGG